MYVHGYAATECERLADQAECFYDLVHGEASRVALANFYRSLMGSTVKNIVTHGDDLMGLNGEIWGRELPSLFDAGETLFQSDFVYTRISAPNMNDLLDEHLLIRNGQSEFKVPYDKGQSISSAENSAEIISAQLRRFVSDRSKETQFESEVWKLAVLNEAWSAAVERGHYNTTASIRIESIPLVALNELVDHPYGYHRDYTPDNRDVMRSLNIPLFGKGVVVLNSETQAEENQLQKLTSDPMQLVGSNEWREVATSAGRMVIMDPSCFHRSPVRRPGEVEQGRVYYLGNTCRVESEQEHRKATDAFFAVLEKHRAI